MNKEQFLAALRARLTALPRADLERTLQYYSEMIDDRVEDGMTEQAAVADVGDPAELAAAISRMPERQTPVRTEQKKKPMSGGKRAALIVCAVLLAAAGLGCILSSLNNIGGKTVEKEYTFANAGITALEIESGAAEVELIPVSGEVCRVVCTEDAGHSSKIWMNEGTLHIERAKKWTLFSVSLSDSYIRVYLPQAEYQSLWIKTSSGSVSVPKGFRFRVAIIAASSGGVGFASDVTEEMNIQTSSGGVAITGASPASLFVSASSGDMTLSDMGPGSASLRISSGSLRLSDMNCGDLDAESSSGSIRLSDVICAGKLTLDCTSGSIKLEDCDAAALRIECTSGSVTGHLLTSKTYVASAVSGSVRVPEGTSGGICEVRTTSGSIRFD